MIAHERAHSPRRGALRQVILLIVLLVLALMMLFPFYFMVQTSLKSDAEFASQFWIPVAPITWGNYGEALGVIWPYIRNSIIVVGLSTFGIVLVSTLAAYAFARVRFVGREQLFLALLSMMMVPAVLTLVPQFVLITNLHLIDTYAGIILPYIAVGEIISIFILRSFFASLPEELFEAARVDGAGDLQIFARIGLPLVRPAIMAVVVLQVLTNWNDYVLPSLVLTDDSVKTLVLGLVSFQTRYSINYGPQMAGYTIGALPLLVLFALGMRQFVAGLTAGALKL